jgi:hypothetical protein
MFLQQKQKNASLQPLETSVKRSRSNSPSSVGDVTPSPKKPKIEVGKEEKEPNTLNSPSPSKKVGSTMVFLSLHNI